MNLGMGKLAVLALAVALGAGGIASAWDSASDDLVSDPIQLQDEKVIKKLEGDEVVTVQQDEGDDVGDGDRTAGNDGTSGGDNTGDGDRTAGNDGTSGGNNTGDGDQTAGNDGTSGGNNTGGAVGGDDTGGGDNTSGGATD